MTDLKIISLFLLLEILFLKNDSRMANLKSLLLLTVALKKRCRIIEEDSIGNEKSRAKGGAMKASNTGELINTKHI